MSTTHKYTYTIVRYVHDVATREFVNVGVILHVPSLGLVEARARPSITRLRGVFPDLDREAFQRLMQAVERCVSTVAKEVREAGLFDEGLDAAGIAARALPKDDSSLQWSEPAGAGLTDNPAKTIDRLHERFVTRYEKKGSHRRTDDEVWRPFRQKLEERHLASLLRESTFTGGVDEIVFKHAWKNGVWHAYEALSFDLSDAEHIKIKAREWRGHLSAVADTTKLLRLHFLVGAPQRADLHDAYAKALAILEKAPVKPEIFEEGQIDMLVDRLEDEARRHVQSEL